MKLGFLRSPFVTLVLIVFVIAESGPDVVHAVDSVIDGNLVFTGPGQGGAKDIRTSNTDGGLRIYNGQNLSAIPEGAAIQFFGNTSASYPGQAYIDSGAHNNAALVFRTAGTGQAITERMRITAGGNVGIGTTTPISTLQVLGNYVQIPAITGAPVAADCNEPAEEGRMVVRIDGTTNFYVCTGTAWVGIAPPAVIIPF
jgi:hypothetical protein